MFSGREQSFYAEKGFSNQPQRCRECRQARQLAERRAASGRRAGRATMRCARPAAWRRPFRSARAATVPSTAAPATPQRCRPASEPFLPVAWDGDASAISISACSRARCATSEPEASTISSTRFGRLLCAGRRASASLLRTASRCCATSLSEGAEFDAAARRLREARPTAVNLAWAVDRVLASRERAAGGQRNSREQIAIDAAIGNSGVELIRQRRADRHALQHRAAGDRRRGHRARRRSRGAARRKEAARLRRRDAAAVARRAAELSRAANAGRRRAR